MKGEQNIRIKELSFVTNSNFLMLISWQPIGENLLYFKLRSLELRQFIVWNI